ncbi:excisionase family DNA-binding protein [Lentzea cavernae]|uniref:Helix-turn-helix domain-containing protein n=1 Tax=Lentzea cavernae TaxID=2020703 RepID=A0ABQ3MPU4_9PSEU|nr:excisionase family DNA-binding protein [Lentzea cavernae]GHH56993.1 hypothetical protein GCM10017774_75830 [Lentzea cavernae]
MPTTNATPGPEQPRILLRVEEAARRLSISRTTMFGLLKSGEIDSVLIGRLRRIPTTALDAYTATLAAGPNAA